MVYGTCWDHGVGDALHEAEGIAGGGFGRGLDPLPPRGPGGITSGKLFKLQMSWVLVHYGLKQLYFDAPLFFAC